MNDFEKRLNKGQELHDHLISFLNSNGIEYVLTGYENLEASSQARSRITKMSDETSQFVRHYPDVTVILPKKSYLVEVKNSSGIERDCYTRYMKLVNDMGLVVLLFLRNRMLCRVQDLLFKRAEDTDPIAKMQIPVIEGVWKTPRLMDDKDYHSYLNAYKQKGRYTSGCAFAFIDFEGTPCYPIESLLIKKQEQNNG